MNKRSLPSRALLSISLLTGHAAVAATPATQPDGGQAVSLDPLTTTTQPPSRWRELSPAELAATAGRLVSDVDRHQFATMLNDRFVGTPNAIDELRIDDVLALVEAMDATGTLSLSQVTLPLVRWAASAERRGSCSDDQLLTIVRYLHANQGAEAKAIIGEVSVALVDRYVADGPSTRSVRTRALQLAGGFDVTDDLKRQLWAKIGQPLFAQRTNEVEPADAVATADLTSVAAVLLASIPNRAEVLAESILATDVVSAGPPAVFSQFARISATPTVLGGPTAKPTEGLVRAIDKLRDAAAAAERADAQRASDDALRLSAIVRAWAPLLVPQDRDRVLSDANVLRWMTWGDADALLRSLMAQGVPNEQGDRFAARWFSIPANGDKLVRSACSQSTVERSAALATLQSFGQATSPDRRVAIVRDIVDRCTSDAAMLDAMALADIVDLTLSLNALGYGDTDLLAAWLAHPTRSAEWSFPIRSYLDLRAKEHRAIAALVQRLPKDLLTRLTQDVRARLEKAAPPLRADGLRFMAQASRAAGTRDGWLAIVATQAQANGVAGDDRAGWLLARAYAEETLTDPLPVMVGTQWGQQAFAAAEGESMRLACAQYMASRFAAADRFTEAEAIVAAVKSGTADAARAEELKGWSAAIASVKEAGERRQARAEQKDDLERLRGQLALLQQRIDDARKAGRSASDVASLERMAANIASQLNGGRADQ